MYWITGFLGVAFALAPFLFGYSENTLALWTSLLLGGAVVVISYMEAVAGDTQRWEYWVAIVLGAGAIIAPFILGFGTHMTALWVSIAVGLMLAAVAGSKLYYDRPRSL